MNFEGNAPLYSGFVLIAIESAWPNPDGDELTQDAYDLAQIDKQGYKNKASQRKGYLPNRESLASVDNEENFQKTQGYYKVIPLNVVQAKTSTGAEGSQFSVTFTLDDLLLLTGDLDSMLNATGIPMSKHDLVESDMEGRLPILQEFKDSNSTKWTYVKDSELGLSRYKINGAHSAFNVEDLVRPNDTVTIWMYHDPQDFYDKDNDAVVNEGNLQLSQDIKNIVGSADRRNQFFTSTPSFTETLLGTLGIVNTYTGESIQNVIDGKSSSLAGQAAKVTQDNIGSILNSFVIEGTQGILGTSAEEQLFAFAQTALGQGLPASLDYNPVSGVAGSYLNASAQAADTVNANSQGSKLLSNITSSIKTIRTTSGPVGKVYTNLLLPYYDPYKKVDEALQKKTHFVAPFKNPQYFPIPQRTPKAVQDGRGLIVSLITRLQKNTNTDSKLTFIAPDITAPQNSTLASDYSSLGISTQDEVNDFVLAVNLFVSQLNNKINSYVIEQQKKQEITQSRQNFSNGRSTLITKAHGETPYLALKGQISGVSTTVGAKAGTHMVTLSGSGFEKILNDNEVYYEDLLYASGTSTLKADFNTVYVNMIPPRAMVHIVNRWAAKQIILGYPTQFTQLAFNDYMLLGSILNSNPKNDKNKQQQDNLTWTGKNALLNGQIPLRGMYVLAEYVQNPEVKNIRLFTPLNYLDTSRVEEMIRTIDSSFTQPETQASIQVAVYLDTRKSVMSNLRKIGGTSEFYEMFMDETGRLRYRLSFEAYERTPKPEYTPTLQDIDVLADGVTFHQDDTKVATLVNVLPLRGKQDIAYYDLGFIGRSTPLSGDLPLENLPNNIPKESLAPDMFRYGLRSLKIDDIYTSEQDGAVRKANIYRLLYENPLKKASIKVKNNSSYRKGETVLVSLRNYKHRSKSLIDLKRMIAWLESLRDDKELREMYVGVDKRLINKDYYTITRGEYLPIPDEGLYREYSSDPHSFVLEQFITTLKFMQKSLDGINVITPEYFPTTYWFFPYKTGKFFAWDENSLDDDVIMELYTHLLRASVLGNKSDADSLGEYFNKYPGIINAVQFQNFRAASYYIEGVTHSYQFGADFSTNLELNYGQDTLVIMDPKKLIPIGHISLEKKMKIGYKDSVQEKLWIEPYKTRSPLQSMYVNQLNEDNSFKKASFLFNSQVFRNSANYMYDLARMEGLDTQLTITNKAGVGPASTYNRGTAPAQASGATDPRAIAYRLAPEYGITDETVIETAANAGTTETAIRNYYESYLRQG